MVAYENPFAKTTIASTSCNRLHEIREEVAEVACENSRLSFLFAARDFSQERKGRKKKKKEKRNVPRSEEWRVYFQATRKVAYKSIAVGHQVHDFLCSICRFATGEDGFDFCATDPLICA